MQNISEAPAWRGDGETVDVIGGDADERGQETVQNVDTKEAIAAIRDAHEADEMPEFILSIERYISAATKEATVADAGSIGYLIYQYRQLIADLSPSTAPGDQLTLDEFDADDIGGEGNE